jgi:competence protein ComEC
MHVALREEEVSFFSGLERWLETERERLPLWVPVFLGVGILAWFGLSGPSLWVAWIGLCGLLAIAALCLPQGGRAQMSLVSIAFLMAAGCILIWGKALLVRQAPMAQPVFTQVEGRVILVEKQAARGQTRVTVAPIGRPDLPARIRVNIKDQDTASGVGRGARISFRSRLMPPPEPDIPGAYDFARNAYFKGLGATGRALPPIKVIEHAPDGTANLRARLADHILSRLGGGGEGALAVTLATGDRGSLSEADEEAMRRSGLAHLLSISGLHVSALIGGVILLVYRVLALSPRLALSLPLMALAAACGALAGIAYTLLTIAL